MLLWDIQYNENTPLNGYVQHLKDSCGNCNITDQHARIYVSSTRADSSNPEVVLGYGTKKSIEYWSTKNEDTNKYIIFAFHHTLKLRGVEINTSTNDWFEGYNISSSMDLIKWDSELINTSNSLDFKPYYFSTSSLSFGKFIKIEPYGNNRVSAPNFALYKVDFYGKIYPEQIIQTETNYVNQLNIYVSYLLMISLH